MKKRRKKPGPKPGSKPKAARLDSTKLVARDHVPEATLETVVAEFSERLYKLAYNRAIDEVLDGMRHSLKAKVR